MVEISPPPPSLPPTTLPRSIHPKAIPTSLKSDSIKVKENTQNPPRKKKFIYGCFHEGHPFKSFLSHIQKNENLARSAISIEELFNENIISSHSA
jgi:hypothetical protein